MSQASEQASRLRIWIQDAAAKRAQADHGLLPGTGGLPTLPLALGFGGLALVIVLFALAFSSPVAPTVVTTAATLPTQAPVTTGRIPEVQKVVDEQVERLFDDPPAPADRAGQQKRVDDYRAIRALATRNGAVMPTGCTVARRAYQVEEFLLGKEAWEDCYLDGQVTTKDRAGLGFYAVTLRNLGRNWAELGEDQQIRYRGLTYLVACQQVVDYYHLSLQECRQDLLSLLGDQAWPTPAMSPLLTKKF